MQAVYPGERKLKRRLMRKIWKDMFINLIKKILGRSTEQKAGDPSDHDKA